MTLNAQQLQCSHALRRYSETLKDTRENYLRLLEAPVVSGEDKNNIWAASLILQYMIASHRKYSNLLMLLEKDERALATLGRLCDRLTVDPAIDLQGFIDKAHAIMQSEEFKSDLTALGRAYNIEGVARVFGVILMMAAAIILGINLLPLIGPWVLPILLLFAVAATYLRITGEDIIKKRDHINRSINSLATEEPLTYSLTEEYSYQAVDTESHSSTSTKVSRTHQPRLKTELRQSFFQSQMNHPNALNVEVQAQFNLLTT